MKEFLRAQAASFIATIIDFLVTIFLVEIVQAPVVPSGVTGNIAGAIVNFTLGRKWVFDPSAKNKVSGQAMKYLLVWLGYLLLNAGAMWLFVEHTKVHYVVAKAIVGVVLAVGYNYVLQKKFVFN